MTHPATVPPPPYSKKTTPPGGGGSTASESSSVKETLESILVAFILAFIFRAFVVEAFVIPTGSMAPTLLGAHVRFRCPDCGWRFEVNYSQPSSGGEDIYIPSEASGTYRVFCPNCGYKLPQNDPANPQNRTTDPSVYYGDRILVLKYLYLFSEPQRWDVVVFKSPDTEPNGGPPTYTQNYIKRLVGKPGESVMILDGDIYIGRPDQEATQYTVQPKPRYAQDALWRIIYDNDYAPQKLMRPDGSKWKQPWRVRDGSGWDTDSAAGGRVFRFNNPAGAGTLFFDRDAAPVFDRQLNPHPYAFTDFLAYDSETDPTSGIQLNFSQFNTVHDLKLSFVYQRGGGDGSLRAKLSSGSDTFIAVISPTDARLFHKTSTEERQVGSPFALPRSARGGGPVRVELTNVDYQVTLRIDDDVAAVTTPQEYHPDVKALLDDYRVARPRAAPSVEIEAGNQTSSLSHVGLWRDVYYINFPGMRRDGRPFAGTPRNIMHLGEDEYFVLGDNSLISGDARYWHLPIDLPADNLRVEAGRVPGRFLLGRAFFVYWPAGYRPVPGLPAGIIPNFGDMRFIR